MIKQMGLQELLRFQKNFYYKNHQHVQEVVFVGEDLESVRVYELCKLCGQTRPLGVDEDLRGEIRGILDKKKTS